MRIVRSILFTFCVALTLATMVAWNYTHRRAGEVCVWDAPPDVHRELTWIPGQVRYTVASGWTHPQPRLRHFNCAPPCYPVLGQKVLRPAWYSLGTCAESGTQTVAYGPGGERLRLAYRLTAVPLSLPAALFGAYPAQVVLAKRRRRLRRARRAAGGLCLECGYDLRASSGKCPECGAAAPPNLGSSSSSSSSLSLPPV